MLVALGALRIGVLLKKHVELLLVPYRERLAVELADLGQGFGRRAAEAALRQARLVLLADTAGLALVAG